MLRQSYIFFFQCHSQNKMNMIGRMMGGRWCKTAGKKISGLGGHGGKNGKKNVVRPGAGVQHRLCKPPPRNNLTDALHMLSSLSSSLVWLDFFSFPLLCSSPFTCHTIATWWASGTGAHGASPAPGAHPIFSPQKWL